MLLLKTLIFASLLIRQFDPKINKTANTPMECLNKGPWHLGISDEACENAGGTWHRTPCVTLKKTIYERPSRFDLKNPMQGTCQENFDRLETAFITASTSHGDFPFEATLDGCHDFCRSLPDYSTQIGMMTTSNACTCVYQNGKLPSRESMPSYAKPSPPTFTLTNSDGMALGLRPNIDCDAAAEDLTIETQISDPNNPRQQFEITQDGRAVSVRCPKKVLTTVLGSDGCAEGVGLQLQHVHLTVNDDDHSDGDSLPTPLPAASDLQKWIFSSNFGNITNVGCSNLAISSIKEKDVSLNSVFFALQNPRTQLAIGTSQESCANEMTLQMQELVYGSLNQQFMYLENENKIVSLNCPNFAITVPNGNCSTTKGLYLSNDSYDDDRNKWSFDGEGIQSLKCREKYITIDGALSGKSRAVSFSSNQFVREVSINGPFPGVSADGSYRSLGGKWFGLNINEWKEYFGITLDSTSTSLEVKQCRYGHAIWIGEVQIYSYGYGRRKINAANTQWEAQDRVVKPNEGCSIVSDDQSSLPSSPSEDDNRPSNTTNYTNTNRTKTVWDKAAPPSVGSAIILSDLNTERYQKWSKQHQVRINLYEICYIVYHIIILSC